MVNFLKGSILNLTFLGKLVPKSTSLEKAQKPIPINLSRFISEATCVGNSLQKHVYCYCSNTKAST